MTAAPFAGAWRRGFGTRYPGIGSLGTRYPGNGSLSDGIGGGRGAFAVGPSGESERVLRRSTVGGRRQTDLRLSVQGCHSSERRALCGDGRQPDESAPVARKREFERHRRRCGWSLCPGVVG